MFTSCLLYFYGHILLAADETGVCIDLYLCLTVSMSSSIVLAWSTYRLHTSKHGAFTQCCFNVGPTSKTAGQH